MNPVKIRNLTPHPVNLPGRVIPAEGSGVRLPRLPETVTEAAKVEIHDLGAVDLVEVRADSSSVASLLPKFDPDTILIVSRMVAEAAPERSDLVWPWAVTKVEGTLVAQGFARVPR
jgi:hypothetical protein